MRIQNNLMAVNTHRQYNKAIGNVGVSAEKLSSGYRINRAGDDAAGLAISEKMRAQIRGLDMASKNSQDAISMVQTAEGALQETHNILQRMRELSVQSASDTNEQSIDRAALNQEFEQLRNEINDIASKTRFNDQNLIDGTFQKYSSSVNSASTDQDFMSNIKTLSVDPAMAGEYKMEIAVVTARAAVVVPGVAAAVNFYQGKSTVGEIIAEGDSLDTLIDQEDTMDPPIGCISQIKFHGFETEKHNGNVYELIVEGSQLDDMSFTLRDSYGNVVSRTNGVDASAWANGESYRVNFEGVGSIEYFMQSSEDDGFAEVNVSTLKSASGIKMHFVENPEAEEMGRSQRVTPAIDARIDLTINGETVSLRKGDTSANFRQNGISFNFNALSDSQFLNASVAFIDPESTDIDIEAMTASVTIGVYESKGAAMTIQTGANMGDELKINIDAMNAEMLGIQFSSIDTQASASRAIEEVNRAINKVSTQRAALGALQNRLEYKTNNLDTSSENLTASESRIRDVDMAKEMTAFTKGNILIQASTAMLAQANQSPQNVLSLLG